MFHVRLTLNLQLQFKYYKMHEFYGNNVPVLILRCSTIHVTGFELTQIQASSIFIRYGDCKLR